MSKNRGSSTGPTSLNYINRRIENVRIEKENHKFARRLFEGSGQIKKREFDAHYNAQEKYKS
jgi:hypothetical protein